MRHPIPSAISQIALFAALLCSLAAVAADQPGRGCVNDRYGNPQCPPPGGRCMADRNGNIHCSTPGGGILLDRYQTPVCGPGHARPTAPATSSAPVRRGDLRPSTAMAKLCAPPDVCRQQPTPV